MVFPLSIRVHETGAVHTARSKYCKVEVVERGKSWHYFFEDKDEELDALPVDWDFKEPVLLAEKIAWNKVKVTGLSFNGAYHVDVYFGNHMIFENLNGDMYGFGEATMLYVEPAYAVLGLLSAVGVSLFALKNF